MILPSHTTTPRHAVFYFDFRDPFSYLAAGRIQKICRDAGVSLTIEPVDSPALDEARVTAPPGEEFWRRVRGLAEAQGLALQVPRRFPFDARLLLKTCLFVRDRSGQEAMVAVADRFWHEVWEQGADPADLTTALRAAKSVAIPEPALRAGLSDSRVDDMLARVTLRARERGVGAVPTVQIESDLFPGSEALPAAERRLRGESPSQGGPPDGAPDKTEPPSLPDWTFTG